MLKEFKEFAMKGNIIDLAIAVIIGSAFGKIVTSLVNDIIMPLLGLLLGGLNVSALKIQMPTLWNVTGKTPAFLNYGNFLQAIIDFLIIAFSIFMALKFLTSFKKKEVAATPKVVSPTKEEVLLGEIRDLLKEQKSSVK